MAYKVISDRYAFISGKNGFINGIATNRLKVKKELTELVFSPLKPV